jgi:EmrB/QacA subfamily drug resistance transporter
MPPGAVRVGLRSERGPVLIALMLSTGLVAIDSTILATAVPSIVASLGGFAQFPWLFSVYLLAQAVTTPIYGKLADLFGRRPMMLLGIGLFMAGSLLCGAAWCMPALIAFRAVQGLGAGAIQPMSLTIAGDLYSTAERARVQGYLASVWAVSAVVGPALGGVFSEYLSWRWIFFVNLPLCLIAVWTLTRNFAERVVRRRHRLDYAGVTLLAAGCTLVILGLLEGGQAWAWRSAPGLGTLVTGTALIIVFVLVERRAAEPVLPLWIFRRRILIATSLIALGVGAVLIGLASYVPTFAQGVLGSGPLAAGFALAALTVGWPVTASLSGRVYLRIGFRATAAIGAAAVVAGAVLTTLLTARATVVEVGAVCFLIGAGFGFVASPTLIAAQATVGWSQRGVVTGTNMFGRSIGSAVGVALFGAIANATLGPGGGRHTAAALARAAHHVFLGVLVLAVALGAAVLAMPRIEAAPAAGEPAGPGADGAGGAAGSVAGGAATRSAVDG